MTSPSFSITHAITHVDRVALTAHPHAPAAPVPPTTTAVHPAHLSPAQRPRSGSSSVASVLPTICRRGTRRFRGPPRAG